jgi:hypothetical protein
MSRVRLVVRTAAAVAFAAVAAACIPGFEWVWMLVEGEIPPFSAAVADDSALPRKGRVQGSAQLGGCASQALPPNNASVVCTLGWSGGYNGSASMTFLNLPVGATIGSVHGGVVVQLPASVTGMTGTYSGTASGNLAIVRLGGAVPADNASSIAAEAGTALWVIESPPNPGTYQFTLNVDESGVAPLPMTAKIMLVNRVAANGRTYYPPMYPCTTSFAAVPALTLPNATTGGAPINFTGLLTQAGCVNKTYDFGPIVQVIEFYNAALDHYFITWVGNEIALLDAGTAIKGWTRTGKSFKAYVTAQAGTTDVCRIYIIPLRGDSHFFGRGQQECSATMTAHPDFVLEDGAFMAMILPSAGVCPVGTVKVYRVFSNRADANHRYMTDVATRAQMAALGWIVEGDGPDAVVMCGPA